MKLVTLKTAPPTALLPTAGADLRAGQPVYFDLERGVVLPLYDLGKALTGLPTGTAAQNVREGDPVQIVTDTPLPDTSGQYTYFIVPEDFAMPVDEGKQDTLLLHVKGYDATYILVSVESMQTLWFKSDNPNPTHVSIRGSDTWELAEDTDFAGLIAAFKRSVKR